MKQITNYIKAITNSTIWTSKKFWGFVWAIVAIIPSIKDALNPNASYNILKIYLYSFYHTLKQISLYDAYPQEYGDLFHYSPSFSALIAPYSLFPIPVADFIFNLTIAGVLFFALSSNVFTKKQQIFAFWYCIIEVVTCHFGGQLNDLIAALIILNYVFIEKEKDIWAGLCLVLGFYIKIYGILGLLFFFFSKHKTRYILSCIGWGLIIFLIPMAYSSPEYIISQYFEWVNSLISKNQENQFALCQNISFLGIVRKWSGCATYSDLCLLIPCGTLYLATFARFPQYINKNYRQTLLASTLMLLCLFSTGTESPTYIIAVSGVAIWYTTSPNRHHTLDKCLMWFCFVVTSLMSTDLCPPSIWNGFIRPYAIKALPVTLIWFLLCYEMLTKDYKESV